jgi:hypothetical protein
LIIYVPGEKDSRIYAGDPWDNGFVVNGIYYWKVEALSLSLSYVEKPWEHPNPCSMLLYDVQFMVLDAFFHFSS